MTKTSLDGLTLEELQAEISRTQGELDTKLTAISSLLDKFMMVRKRAYLTALKLNLSRRVGKPADQIIPRKPCMTPVDMHPVAHEPLPPLPPASEGEDINFELDLNELLKKSWSAPAELPPNVISFSTAGARVRAKRQEKNRGSL
jgi:hypothetical protein